MIEWFIDEPKRGQIALTISVLAITGGIVWFGRRKLSSAIPAALVFLFLAFIAIPSAIPARPASQRAACIYNLRLIDNAKAEWARVNGRSSGEIPSGVDLCSTNGVQFKQLACPRGGAYSIGKIGENPVCSLANKGHRLK